MTSFCGLFSQPRSRVYNERVIKAPYADISLRSVPHAEQQPTPMHSSFFSNVRDLTINGGSFSLIVPRNGPVVNYHNYHQHHHGPIYTEALEFAFSPVATSNHIIPRGANSRALYSFFSKIRRLIWILPASHIELARYCAGLVRRQTTSRDLGNNILCVVAPWFTSYLLSGLPKKVRLVVLYIWASTAMIDFLHPPGLDCTLWPSAKVTVLDALGKYHDFPWAACENMATFHEEYLKRTRNQPGFLFIRTRSYEVQYDRLILPQQADWRATVQPSTELYVQFVVVQVEATVVECPWCKAALSSSEEGSDICTCSQCAREVTVGNSLQAGSSGAAPVADLRIREVLQRSLSDAIRSVRVMYQLGGNTTEQPETPVNTSPVLTPTVIRSQQTSDDEPGDVEQARTSTNNDSDPRDDAVTSDSAHSESTDHDIYYDHLLGHKRGTPMYCPGPSNQLPNEYRKTGIRLGDVGTILRSGSFDYLFNLFHSADHDINKGRVPEGFRPCPLQAKDIKKGISYAPGSFLASSSCRKRSDSGSDYIFESTESEGAVLVLPEGAVFEELFNPLLKDYIAKNITSWYVYARNRRGRVLENGDLAVVTGFDKAPTWGIATFNSNKEPVRLEFKKNTRSGSSSESCAYKWDIRGNASGRVGPLDIEMSGLQGSNEHSMNPPMNQTIFVRALYRAPEFRNRLNSFCQKKWQRHGVCQIEVSDIGTPSAPNFEAVCYINDDEYSRKTGSSRSQAKEGAAEAALTGLLTEHPSIYV